MAIVEQIFDPYLSTATGTQISIAAEKVASMEGTLSGTAGVIPSSKAVKDAIDARVPESSGLTYYTVFDEDNCQVIDGYSYTAGEDTLTAAVGEKCYLVDVNFDGIYITGRNITFAIISGLDGINLTGKTYSSTINNPYAWSYDLNTAFKDGKGTKKLLFYSPTATNGPGIYAMESHASSQVFSIFGVSNNITDVEYIKNAVSENGRSVAIVTAYNNHGELPSYLTNKLVVNEEQSHMVGSAYAGKLSLCPMGDYPSNSYHIRYCPNITTLNVDVSDNTNIKKVFIDYNLQLNRLYLKMNSDQEIRLSANPNLRSVELAGQYTIGEPSVFYQCPSLEKVDLTNATQFTILSGVFQSCTSLTWVDMSNIPLVMTWNKVNSNTFLNCANIETLIGDHTLAEVQAGTITCLTGMKYSLSISGCTKLNRATLLAIIKGVHDFTQDSGYDENNSYATLTFGETLLDKLEESDVEEILAKGWDIE